MVTINLFKPAERRIDLGSGVVIDVAPVTVAGFLAARSIGEAHRPDDEGDDARAERRVLITKALARRVITGWTGVAGPDGAAAEASPAHIDAALELYPLYAAFEAAVVVPLFEVEAQKNV